MKTFIITYWVTVGGIGTPISYDIRVSNESKAVQLTAKKHLLFSVSESYFNELGVRMHSDAKKYVNYDGVLELV